MHTSSGDFMVSITDDGLISRDSESPTIQLRYLCPLDVTEVKALCKEIFPVEYPDYWYFDITSDPNLWSMAATYCDKIIGICVAEVKRLNQCNTEDRDILSKTFPANTPVCYMLSLGVQQSWRRRGVASILLDHLLAYLQNGLSLSVSSVRALYLHVLVSNLEAISFYERRKFRRNSRQKYYYNINGVLYDGYTYVLYLNGGQPPWSFSDTVAVCSYFIFRPWSVLWQFFRSLLLRALYILSWHFYSSRVYDGPTYAQVFLAPSTMLWATWLYGETKRPTTLYSMQKNRRIRRTRAYCKSAN